MFSFFGKKKSTDKDRSRSPSPIPTVVVDHVNQDDESSQPGSTTANATSRDVRRGSLDNLVKQYNLNEETLANYKEAFRMFDRDGDGSITTNELGSVMHSLGCRTTFYELESFVHQIDDDGNGTIEFEEFVRLMVERLQKHTADEDDDLRKAFEVFDRDHDGYVSAKDLKLAMRSLGEKLSEVELREMINEADKDGDGKVNFDEFQSMWKN